MLSHVQVFATPWTVARQVLCSWDCLDKSAGVGCRFLPQGVFLAEGLNPSFLFLLHLQAGSYHRCHLERGLSLGTEFKMHRSFILDTPQLWFLLFAKIVMWQRGLGSPRTRCRKVFVLFCRVTVSASLPSLWWPRSHPFLVYLISEGSFANRLLILSYKTLAPHFPACFSSVGEEVGCTGLMRDEQEFELFQWRELILGIKGECQLPFFPGKRGGPNHMALHL